MPRHSPGQPGAMVTDRDARHPRRGARVVALLVVATVLVSCGYLVYANADHIPADSRHAVAVAPGRS